MTVRNTIATGALARLKLKFIPVVPISWSSSFWACAQSPESGAQQRHVQEGAP